jgi:hypothetical protein
MTLEDWLLRKKPQPFKVANPNADYAIVMEAEKTRKETAYRQEVQVLLQRFQTLPDDLKAKLKTQGRVYLETLVPNTPKKAMLMEEKRFQKIAFKEVAASFFALLDQGFSTDHALAQLAA